MAATESDAPSSSLHFPINDLPPELLSRMFELGLLTVPGTWHLSSHRAERSKLIHAISQVSSYWRSRALSTPAVWSTIIVRPFTPFGKLIAYLERSASVPLDIFMDITVTGEGHEAAAMDVLIPLAQRWRTFEYEYQYKRAANIVPNLLVSLHVPLLEELTLRDVYVEKYFPWNEQQAGLSPIFSGSDSLSRLQILRLIGTPIALPLPVLPNLRTLDIRYITGATAMSLNEFCNCLEKSSLLENLSILGCPISTFDAEQIQLQNLKAITIRKFDTPQQVIDFLSLLVAPKLQTLQLIDFKPADYGPLTRALGHAFGPLAGISDSLESLAIGRFKCGSPGEFEEMLCRLTNLRRLEILRKGPDDGRYSGDYTRSGSLYFRAFSLPAQRSKDRLPQLPNPVPCRLLEEVAVKNVDWSVMRSVANARNAVGCPLKAIIFRRSADLIPSSRQYFERLGIKIILPDATESVDSSDN